MNVLIIDDNTLHLRMCSILLEKMKHTVVTAESLNDLKKITDNMSEPDVALIDFRLEPGVTGIDVINYLRTVRNWNKLKCVALTADVGEQSVMKNAGFDNIIYKPVTDTQLAETLKKYE